MPVVLGDGIRLYGDPAGPRVDLELIVAEQHGSQIANLRYRVSRA